MYAQIIFYHDLTLSYSLLMSSLLLSGLDSYVAFKKILYELLTIIDVYPNSLLPHTLF